MSEFKFENLPKQIPVFPLSSALLLPGGRIPFHIFEPRYIEMINVSLRKNLLFGLVQPRALEHKTLLKSDLLYPIGCLGEITDVTELDNGVLDIMVLGLCRYRIIEEVEVESPFRQVTVDYTPFQQDFDLIEDLKDDGRQQLLKTVSLYMIKQGLSLNNKTLSKLGDGELVTALSMMCPFDPAEKQALLENNNIALRAATLKALMEFAIADIDGIYKMAHH
jgi:uncharacterized protein